MGGLWERARGFGSRRPLRGERERLGKEELTAGPRMSAAGERERRGEGMLAGWLGQAGQNGRRKDWICFFKQIFKSIYKVNFEQISFAQNSHITKISVVA